MTQIITNGISFSRLLDSDTHEQFLDLIKCKICFNILSNPYDCNSCGNSFCFDCINNIIINKQSCPFKCIDYSIKPSSFGITSYLAKLEFCCLNKKNGCNESLSYTKVLDHEKECKFFYTTCSNTQCKKTMKWTLMENHLLNDCEYSLFKCPYCDMEFQRKEHKDHIENCESIKKSLKYSVNSQPNLNRIDINNLIQSLPDLKEVSLVSFMKILLYQVNRSNQFLYDKMESLTSELKELKEDNEKTSKNTIDFYENINSELEHLNNKIEFIEMNDSIKQNIQDTINNYKDNGLVKSSQEDSLIGGDSEESNNKKISRYNSSEISEGNSRGYNKRKSDLPIGLDKISEVKSNDKKQQYQTKEKKGKKIDQDKKDKKSSGYIPKDPNIYLTPHKSDNNIVGTIGGSEKKYNPPIARPFNTFSNFTNSNLITIINNQEIILKHLNEISKKIDTINRKELFEVSKKLKMENIITDLNMNNIIKHVNSMNINEKNKEFLKQDSDHENDNENDNENEHNQTNNDHKEINIPLEKNSIIE